MNQRYMTHPVHGRMPIYSDEEAEFNRKNGWVEDVAVKQNPIEAKIEEMETIQDKYEKKFGKRPHWKMKTENIKAALEE